ncbi:DUF2510 domain-containing protein [Streptomyces sp. NPDC004111]|uniref:DUF2510 domain-containing protein n=1 Tax=Streptomyces sp. NPDC004111 TaxID=3364690 RepID=UPI0036ADAA40
MSMTTPPGWYQDPSAPTQERWWDGSAWSAHTRAPGGQQPAAAQFGPAQPPQPQGYGYPQGAQPGYATPPPPPAPPGAGGGSGGGPGGGKLIAVVAAGVVLVAAIVTGVVFLGKEDTPPAPPPVPTLADPPGAGQSTPTAPSDPAPPAASGDADILADQLNGITLPILPGWEKPEYGADRDAATMTTKETYDCPADGGFCRHGTVTSRTAPGNLTAAEAAAKADIKIAADVAYHKDSLDRQKYGGIKSHQEIKSEQVTVAGKQGYLVRWKVVTGKGPGGYVQSLAFPSSLGPGSIVLVRFAFDAGPGGPPLDGMDKITQGIRNTT